MGNAAGMSTDDQARIWRKLRTRNTITEVAVPKDGGQEFPRPGLLVGPAAADPSLVINREAVALYSADPQVWNSRSFESVYYRYVSDPTIKPSERHKAVYTGWNLNNWGDPQSSSSSAAKMADPILGNALTVQRKATGMFVECGYDHCARPGPNWDSMVRAIRSAHDANEPFIWFTSPGPSNQVANFKAGYQHFASLGLWRTNDVVMLINYRGEFPMLPETVDGEPANTVTGMLYWALRQ